MNSGMLLEGNVRPKVCQKLILNVIFAIFVMSFSACRQKELTRPYGYLKIGKVQELNKPESYLEEFKLLLRKDEKGFYVMSTMCTHDLTYLVRKTKEDKTYWASEYTSSYYDQSGKVLAGPAVSDLPYYKMRFEPSVYGGPRDTLYVYVGENVPKDWRLQINSVSQ